ncbi:MAG: peroxiredoxin [Propionibacteriaceae bacterium]|nr:peroxiredoxin [Propionibacteriaceae bacterium]
MAQLVPGDIAPDFCLLDAQESEVSLKNYADSKVVVYFYPKAMTAGCTTEAVDFTAASPSFADAGYSIVGISPDKPASLAKFIDRDNLDITLLSDVDKATIEAYGAWGEKKLYGKVTTGIIRSTFVVNVDAAGIGTVELAEYNVRAAGHVERLSKQLGISA